MRSVARVVPLLTLAALALLLIGGAVLAQSPEEIEEVVRAITGDLSFGEGVALSSIVVIVVGLIRRFTGLDGPRVKLVVFAVSILAVAGYHVLEGGLELPAAILTALGVFVGAILGHETVGKWIRELFGGAGKESAQTGTG